MRFLFYLFLVFLFFPLASSALEIKSLHLSTGAAGEHIALYLSTKAKYSMFMTDTARPLRVVIDLPAARWTGNPALPPDYKGMIRKIRFGYYNTKTTRIVFEVADNVQFANTKLTHRNGQQALEFDLLAKNGKKIPVSKAPAASGTATGSTSAEEVEPVSKPLIVIDAGHGGQDPGTSGFNGSREKDITLAYAKALQAALLATGRYNVALTRMDDRYLLLGERVRRARAAKGNLFISIHADSDPTASARGLSVYTLSGTASDRQTEALAQKENKADVIGGIDLSATSQDVAEILIDLTQRETRLKSDRFAEVLVRQFRSRALSMLSHTHRSAGFAVLKSPDIPSVLIETGFITNPKEEKLLLTSSYKERFMEGVVKAIDVYFHKLH